MADVHTPEIRSKNMRAIRGKNTRIEVQIRSALHARGFRYRLHAKNLPGKPDLVLAKYRAVIFIHGCFWHKHECSLFHWPQNNRAMWKEKIEKNHARDILQLDALRADGWRTLVCWECALRGENKLGADNTATLISSWLLSDSVFTELTGRPNKN